MEFKDRFRGFYPVVLDLETGGFDANQNPILEIGCQFLVWRGNQLQIDHGELWSVEPFPNSVIEPASTKVTGIDVNDPAREALDEKTALVECFKQVRKGMKEAGCHRAILVAHNAAFDMGFIQAGCLRTAIKRNPFHPFSSIDTASLAAVAYGHTVLAEVCRRAGLEFDNGRAHGALYDSERTAALFCQMVNQWPAQSIALD